jgi:hypothetical protein
VRFLERIIGFLKLESLDRTLSKLSIFSPGGVSLVFIAWTCENILSKKRTRLRFSDLSSNLSSDVVKKLN